jgi:hypothetical protein
LMLPSLSFHSSCLLIIHLKTYTGLLDRHAAWPNLKEG